MDRPVDGKTPEAQFPVGGEASEISRRFWELPRSRGGSIEERLDRLEAETELRELQARFFDAVDNSDVDTVMSLHHPDCALTGVRGAFTGTDPVREEFEVGFGKSKIRMHSATDSVIRFVNSDEAWVLYRTQAAVLLVEDRIKASASMMAQHLKKNEGEWLIVATRCTTKLEYDLGATFDTYFT